MDDSSLTVEKIYHEIARHFMRAINEPWATATPYVEIEEEDNGPFYGRYQETVRSGEEKFFDPLFAVLDQFVALRQQLQQPGKAPWQAAPFTLDRSGHFTIDFSYPDNGAPRAIRPRDVATNE